MNFVEGERPSVLPEVRRFENFKTRVEETTTRPQSIWIERSCSNLYKKFVAIAGAAAVRTTKHLS
ncbi:hypothetical protein RX330_11305 [Bradyrhizobium sp. NDS-1]|uniref:hypothetical protein n=1 Tax=Bradyrhizobium sp. NDS-1 TaxID=3080014 RepID=UPI00293E6542|nr:hypothetical protein [Bradyrhizobium sp. NDS-1]WOH75630.1 hypothetical protein RX330_11305 [Bradyrhizobium sp. NDS-1]